MDRLTITLIRSLFQQTRSVYELGALAAIDAYCFDRVVASHHYATHTDYRFQSLKTTIFVDCDTGAILDVDCATTKPHDT